MASLDPWPADGTGARERHIGSPSLVTGSARAKQKHVLRRGGEGREGNSKQASNKEGGPPLHATHPSHGPPATHNLYLHEIARSCISNTHKIKNWKSRPTRTSSVHVFQLGGAGGRVLISRDDDWR